MNLPAAPKPSCSESVWMAYVTDCLDLGGWTWYHTYDSRKSTEGFPDIVACHPKRGLLFAELKTERGKLTDRQLEWLRRLTVPARVLSTLPDVQVYVRLWRPSDYEEVLSVTGLAGRLESIGGNERT